MLILGEGYVIIYCSVTCIIHFKRIIGTLWSMQLQTLQYDIGIKVAFIINKSPLVGEHVFPQSESVRLAGWLILQ